SGGHSEATLDQTSEAIGNGMSMITHLYCAMSTITKKGPFRIPGMLETTLFDDRLATELIADLKHVSRELIMLALKAKAERTLRLGTSSVRALLVAGAARVVEGLEARRAHAVRTTPDGGAELDGPVLLREVEEVIDEILAAAGPRAHRIRAVACCTFWHSVM